MKPIAGLMALGVCALALGACGNTRELMPVSGRALPTAPYGLGYRPGPNELLQRPTQAVPARNVELRTRSQDREDNPFDLPPEN